MQAAEARRCPVQTPDEPRKRGFIFEHPLSATSWQQECLANLMQDKRVYTTEVHMCAYDLKATDEKGEGLVMKPTRVLTNIRPVAENLTGRCCGGHRHVHLVGGRARGAAAYPQRFCENVLKSIDVWVKQKRGGRADRHGGSGVRLP